MCVQCILIESLCHLNWNVHYVAIFCWLIVIFFLHWKQKYSAASLCSITTEVLKVLNATEELIGEAGGDSYTPSESMSASPISSSSETRRLDQRLTKMEENVRLKNCFDSTFVVIWRLHFNWFSPQVYLAAGAVYGLEGALGELEQCARSISCATSDTELAFLEDQVATAAAQVQQSELQVQSGIIDCFRTFWCCFSEFTAHIASCLNPFVREDIEHRGQNISSENSWVECDCLQSLCQA